MGFRSRVYRSGFGVSVFRVLGLRISLLGGFMRLMVTVYDNPASEWGTL